MKRFFLLSALSFLCTSVLASAWNKEEHTVTQDIDVVEFTELAVSVPCVINYEVGEPSMHLEGLEKSVENIFIKVVNGKLTISSEKKLVRNLSRVVINLSSATLTSVTVNGTAEFKTAEGFENTDLTIALNGAGVINASNVTADNLKVTLNGAGKIRFSEVFCQESLKVTINGAGDAVVAGYARNANLKINGAGGIDILGLSSEKLSSTVNGVGSIRAE